ncbi:hypothetical protein ACJX0J_032385, partial [Zea mays]
DDSGLGVLKNQQIYPQDCSIFGHKLLTFYLREQGDMFFISTWYEDNKYIFFCCFFSYELNSIKTAAQLHNSIFPVLDAIIWFQALNDIGNETILQCTSSTQGRISEWLLTVVEN